HLLQTFPTRRSSDLFLRLGNRCPKCNNKNKMKTHEQFQKEFEKTCDGEYELLSKYKGSHSFIKVKHLKCGNIWEQKATNWISGYRCTKCRASHGEREITKIKIKHTNNFKKS